MVTTKTTGMLQRNLCCFYAAFVMLACPVYVYVQSILLSLEKYKRVKIIDDGREVGGGGLVSFSVML